MVNPNVETPLTRAATQISQEIIPILRDTLIGRRFASINPYMRGDGKTALELTEVSDLSDGFIQWQLPTGNEFDDAITSNLRIVNVPVLYKKFSVRKEDIYAWDNRKIAPGEQNSLNSITSQTAARKVAEQEETMIFSGWKPNGSDYLVKGFSEAAANQIAGGSISVVGTFFQYVVDAISAIEADNMYGDNGAYNLAITPAIKAALLGKRYQNGDREWAEIQALLNGGQIFTSRYVPDKTALVLPVDNSRQYFEFLNPVDYRIEFAEPKFASLSPVEGMCYELFVPNYNYIHANGTTDAICKITNVTPQ